MRIAICKVCQTDFAVLQNTSYCPRPECKIAGYKQIMLNKRRKDDYSKEILQLRKKARLDQKRKE